MIQHRTTRCTEHGHREITIQTVEDSPIPNVARILIDFFEDGVASGTTFLSGQIVRLGWSLLRLCERADGTLGVEERELSPQPVWVEQVDRALRDTWYQKAVCESVGLVEELTFPLQDDDVMVSDCSLDAELIVMTRFPSEDLPEGISGWSLACAEDHDHGERTFVPLMAVAANQPALVQFLALPHDLVVLVGQTDEGRIDPRIYRRGDELVPQPGSYLAALRGAD